MAIPSHGSAVRAGRTLLSQLVRQDVPQSESFCAQAREDDKAQVSLWGTVAVHHRLSIVGGQEESSALSLPAQPLQKKTLCPKLAVFLFNCVT